MEGICVFGTLTQGVEPGGAEERSGVTQDERPAEASAGVAGAKPVVEDLVAVRLCPDRRRDCLTVRADERSRVPAHILVRPQCEHPRRVTLRERLEEQPLRSK